jgi:hypothetical protein
MTSPMKPMKGLDRSIMKIDKPHAPYGPHVDVITPLGENIPGVQKLRIGPNGEILTDEFVLKKKW